MNKPPVEIETRAAVLLRHIEQPQANGLRFFLERLAAARAYLRLPGSSRTPKE